jgi:predicted small lipoprotein YifL
MARSGLYLVIFYLFVLLFAVTGCGRKTMVVPPQSVVPASVDDLKFSLTEKGVMLNWSFPQQTVQGETLSRINSFELLRAEVPVEDYCEGCPQPFGPPVAIQGGTLPDDGAGRQARFEDTPLRPGHHYVYKVRSRAGWRGGSSADSNIVNFVWEKPERLPSPMDGGP